MNQIENDRLQAEFIRTDPTSDPFVSAVKYSPMPMTISDPNKPNNPIIFVNDAFLKLTGYKHDEIVGNNCRLLQGAETNQDNIAKIRAAIEQRIPIDIDVINFKKSGQKFWNRLMISPVFDKAGALTYFVASQYDVTLEYDKVARMKRDLEELERQIERRTLELTATEAKMKFVLNAGRFGSWTLDLAEMRLAASDLCKENFGRNVDDPFSYQELFDSIIPDDQDRMKAAVKSSILDNTDYDIEYRVHGSRGEIRWLQIRGQAHYSADGVPLSMAGVSIDITERKRNELHKKLLTDELNHRVKNSMATLQSIAAQTLRSANSLKEAEVTLNERIQSLATAHNVLTRESWEGADLREVVESALAAFKNGSRDRFIFNGPRIWMSPRLSLAFVLALHELATNAVKYGALSNNKGRVLLNWDIVDGASPERIWLRWEEIGGPEVAQPTRVGFGTKMIQSALAAELGGKAEIDYRSSGLIFTIEAPIPPKAIDSRSSAIVIQ